MVDVAAAGARLRIFISYSKKTPEPTVRLAEFLESHGHSVWWDTDLTAGEVFREVIDRELDRADAVIVIWTESSVASHWVIAEADHGAQAQKLITLKVGDLPQSRIPKPYNVRHTEPMDNTAAVLRALARFTPAQGATAAPAPRPLSGDVRGMGRLCGGHGRRA
jgi:TIR domain